MCAKQDYLSVFLRNIESDSVLYPELRNYKAYETLLIDKLDRGVDSCLSNLVNKLLEENTGRSVVDLACTLAGVMNQLAYKESCQKLAVDKAPNEEKRKKLEEDAVKEARDLFWDDDGSGKKLNGFVKRHFKELLESTCKLNNCPTIPQRAFPLATFLPRSGSIGVLEFGCSRGDLGLVLLDPKRFLRPGEKEPSPYLFSKPTKEEFEQYQCVCPNKNADEVYRQFGTRNTDNSGNVFPQRSLFEILQSSRAIDKYFGVDIRTEENQADWLLSLWGLRDPRRKVLKRFYDDFRTDETDRFKRRLGTNALDVDKYLPEVLEFMSGVDNLVIFTSYMIYQLSISERHSLVSVIRKIKENFKKGRPDKNFYWFNQGNSVADFFSKTELDFNNLFFSELKFNEDGKVCGCDLAWLLDDCNTNWRTPTIFSDFLKTIIKDYRGAYPQLRNYEVYEKLLQNKNSSLSRLVKQLIERQPSRNLKDLTGTLAGAMNLLAYREAGAEYHCDSMIRDSEISYVRQEGGTTEYKELGKVTDEIPKKDDLIIYRPPEDGNVIEYSKLERVILEEACERLGNRGGSGKNDGDSGEKLDEFVRRHYNQLLDITLSRTNCLTIPQRAFPLATFLPEKGSIGVLELGCSRGDLGVALLNIERLLRPGNNKGELSPYLFSKTTCESVAADNVISNRQFGDECSIKYTDLTCSEPGTIKSGACPKRTWYEILRNSRSIDRYFGVDFKEKKQTEPNWLLALWGLGDPRRKVLERFYRDFKAEESCLFKRTVADVLDVEQYLGDALNFMSGVDNLVIVTSYLVGLLNASQRLRLVDSVRRIKNVFETRFPGKNFYWFNQGISVTKFFNESDLSCNDLYCSELNFNEAGRLYGRDLALLADECHSNWHTPHILVLYGGPSRESLISVKSANTVINNLNKSGFSCSDLEIPQDVLEETSCVDKARRNNQDDYLRKLKEAKTDNARADVRVNDILDRYAEVNGKPDLVFPYLHGSYGEDGKLQEILENRKNKDKEEKGWAYVGCDTISSNLGMDKHLSKKIWNAQAPSREYWAEQENNKRLTTYEWDERLRQNSLLLFERIKIRYDDGSWQVFEDDFIKRFFDLKSYNDVKRVEKLKELFTVMLRRWEYDVFIYKSKWDSDFENSEFSFVSDPEAKLGERKKDIFSFLEKYEKTDKCFIVEQRYQSPILTAPWIVLEKGDSVQDITTSIQQFNNRIDELYKDKKTAEREQYKLVGSCILKPYNSGSSFGIRLIDSSEKLADSVFNELKDADGGKYILEKRLVGKDVTVSVLGEGQDLIVLPPIQICPRGDIYDYDAKYFQEDTTYLFQMFPLQPAYLQTMKNIAAKAYRMLGCRDFARIDLLMVDEKDPTKKRFYVLEVNTLPGATVHSLTPKAALKVGFTLPEFFRFVVDKAFYRYSSNYAMREIEGQD